ncbi:glial fibrillary acidic protein-like [Cucumis melo var. makuwa]|uniref:Glial fibrillary acidic protein-like n=1 Tax=Cucumis melo var. makuwa TaxID=1194695 RepID=A0A5A7TUU7_CUCMM|nr:glial fibrillary acidic protein-like [Cucumis melo var. makuwa]
MVDTYAFEAVVQLIPNEDLWENVSQWSEHFQLESGVSWLKKLEVSLPKTCQLGFINNNLEELKSLWENLMLEHRVEFTKAYGSIENEKLREEVKKWVQQAVITQRDLDEAKRKQLELEKENDSLNTEAIQVRKKNKRLLRNIANLHEETEAKKVAIDDYTQLIEKYQEMSIDFMMWRDEYEILRWKYDSARGQMERGAEKLRQMARMADQLSVQARTL